MHQINFSAIATSVEGAQVTIPVAANVVPLMAQLIANPGYLSSGMVVGQQSVLSFVVQNTGGASSGDLTVQLPANQTWLTLGSPAIIPSIPAGGQATVTLILNPPADLTLTLYKGNVALFNNNYGLSEPFQIRAVSDSAGSLEVSATDDYTYYVAGAPKVTNAVITVRDAITGAVIAQTNSDANGIAEFPSLPAGPYTVNATATEHDQFQGSVTVAPGVTNTLEAFMAMQLVTAQWTVVPSVISDQYEITLQSTFQTEVPVPNVVVMDPEIVQPVAPGVSSQFMISLCNEGLIAAKNVSVIVPSNPNFIITPLVTNLDTIPAQSIVQIPVTVQMASAPATNLVKQSAVVHANNSESADSNCQNPLSLEINYGYPCGNHLISRSSSLSMKPVVVTPDTLSTFNTYYELTTGYFKSQAGKLADRLEGAQSYYCGLVDVGLDKLEMSDCQKAAFSGGCNAIFGGILGSVEGAEAAAELGPEGAGVVGEATLAGFIGGAVKSAALNPDTYKCLCEHLPVIPLPPYLQVGWCPVCGWFNPSRGGGGGDYGDYGGGGGGWISCIDPVYITTSVPGTDCSYGSPQAAASSGTSALTPRVTDNQTATPKDASGGVCATVVLQIKQRVVMSRSAFTGTLQLSDGGSTSISDIQVNLTFQDAYSEDASDKFVIEGPVLNTLTAVDGTGTLAGGASGTATYTFIPTDDAAPDAPASYQISGTLIYNDSGRTVTVPLVSAPITVYPEAKLDLIYFQQRDVYGPDPLDPALNEPSQPFDLGLIVKNVGAGMAHSFQIASGQPQIVDNEKGLLINFSIIGTEVGDQSLSPSLSANLGDISPGASKEVDWELLSTLAGKFISFNATFTHVDDMGNTNTSLIDSVEIHSLTHKVLADRTNDDDVPDFLVNDIPNPDSLPDTLYLSDGTVAPVNVVTDGNFDGPAGPGHLAVQLTTIMSNGWNYIQLPDPGVGYILTQVVRSDGEVVPMTNDAWTTSLSFPSSSTAPVPENLVHLFDWAGTGSYILYYHSTNTTPPAIISARPGDTLHPARRRFRGGHRFLRNR